MSRLSFKALRSLIAISFSLLWVLPAKGEAFYIQNYYVHITLNADASFDVVEEIDDDHNKKGCRKKDDPDYKLVYIRQQREKGRCYITPGKYTKEYGE